MYFSSLQTVAFEVLSICSPGSNHSEPKSFFLMLSLCTLFYNTRLLHASFQRMLLYDIKAEGFKWTVWDCFLEDCSGILNILFPRSFAILLTSYSNVWNLSWFWVIASLCKSSINGFIMATIKKKLNTWAFGQIDYIEKSWPRIMIDLRSYKNNHCIVFLSSFLKNTHGLGCWEQNLGQVRAYSSWSSSLGLPALSPVNKLSDDLSPTFSVCCCAYAG